MSEQHDGDLAVQIQCSLTGDMHDAFDVGA